MEKKEKIEAQKNAQYQSFGRFNIEFEQMCLNIRTCITFAMHMDGLKEQQLIRILLADQTAYPLIVKLRSIVSILYQNKPDTIKHLSPLFKFCLKVNEQRNDIIHGSWFVGRGSQEQEEFNVASGMKDKITSNGVKLNTLSYEHINFDELTEKIILAKELLGRLNGCIVGDFEILKNIDSDQIEKLNTAANKT
jgi:hypothetical protein